MTLSHQNWLHTDPLTFRSGFGLVHPLSERLLLWWCSFLGGTTVLSLVATAAAMDEILDEIFKTRSFHE